MNTLCPVCRTRPVRPRAVKTGVAPTTCSQRCTQRANECRRRGVPIDTPVMDDAQIRAARAAGGRKRKGGQLVTLPDGRGVWGTPDALARGRVVLAQSAIGLRDIAVALARIEPLVERVETINRAMDSWFLRGFVRGRAEKRGTS